MRYKSQRIFKYDLLPCQNIADGSFKVVLEMPNNAKVLCVQMQGPIPRLWAVVDEDSPKVPRTVYIVGTGRPLPANAGDYLGTWQEDGGEYIWHAFISREDSRKLPLKTGPIVR